MELALLVSCGSGAMRHRDVAERKRRKILRARGLKAWEDIPGYARILLKTRAPCSCVMCGNPRRHFGAKTRQERIADEDMAEQLREWVD